MLLHTKLSNYFIITNVNLFLIKILTIVLTYNNTLIKICILLIYSMLQGKLH